MRLSGIDTKAMKITGINVTMTVPMKRARKLCNSGCMVRSGGLIEQPSVECRA